MRVTTLSILLALLLLSFKSKDIPHYKLKADHFKAIKCPEPSDVVYDKESGHLYIVSDHGKLYECDMEGKIIRKAEAEGIDFEGVELRNGYVYVSDELPRKIYQYKKSDLSLVKTYSVPYSGGMNAAFESITWNESKHCFVLISEKNPTIIFEYNEEFEQQHKYYFHDAKDISSARWYNGKMYLLSDEDHCILTCDPVTYKVEEKYNVNVYNPEGLAFDNEGGIKITSDNLERLYTFKSLQTVK